ncbi:MAG: YkvA family protein [Pseudomonadota bacterium]|nr:YkvA family protein [Pseudomonadota bacterium]
MLALASVLGVGEGHLLHRETRWVGSRYFAKSESLFQSFLSVLAYFIAPLDAIPDFTPLVGFTDDLGVFASALAMVAMYIDRDVQIQARERAESWFGPHIEEVFEGR